MHAIQLCNSVCLQVTLGRAPCNDIVLTESNAISRSHVALKRNSEGLWTVADLVCISIDCMSQLPNVCRY